MSSANKYFEKPGEPPEHPRVRAWKSYRKLPTVDHVGVEILREREGLTFLPTRIFVDFLRADGELVKQDEAPWELELEKWLIDTQRAKARTIDNEKLRFSLLLKPKLRPILVRYGDGYFNSVLVADLREGPYSGHAEVAAMLRSIHEAPPHADSRYDCQQLIDHELASTGQALLKLYNGDRAVAEDILGGAIAHYLDDRFSVTNSRRLGFTQ